MKLLPKEVAKQIPKLYAQEHRGDETVVYLKFFDLCSNWTWYVTEYDGIDTFFGLVIGHVAELGYFSLRKLQRCKNRFGLTIERDIHFTPMTLKELKETLSVRIC